MDRSKKSCPLAEKERKLLFLIQVSGNFASQEFT
jgi:hypothetical protein